MVKFKLILNIINLGQSFHFYTLFCAIILKHIYFHFIFHQGLDQNHKDNQ